MGVRSAEALSFRSAEDERSSVSDPDIMEEEEEEETTAEETEDPKFNVCIKEGVHGVGERAEEDSTAPMETDEKLSSDEEESSSDDDDDDDDSDDDSEEDADVFDADAIVRKALGQEISTSSGKKETISWDIDVGELNTYFEQDHKLKLDIGAGERNLLPVTLPKSSSNSGGAVSSKSVLKEHKRGETVPSLKPSVLTKEELKSVRDRTRDWKGSAYFGLPKQEMTKDLKRELEILKLRKYANPSRHYRGNDSNKLPTHFHIGVEVGGGLQAVGANTNVTDTMGMVGAKKRKGISFAKQLIGDDTVQSWTRRRTKVVNEWGQNGKSNKKPGSKLYKKNASWKRSKKK